MTLSDLAGADPAAPAAVVALDRVSASYQGGLLALDKVTFALAPGSFTFVTGGSGAGKTSLLSIIGLALQPSAGTLRVLGHDVTELDRQDRAALRREIEIKKLHRLEKRDLITAQQAIGAHRER